MLELLAPAGSPEAVRAAVCAGADAIYLGYGRFNARRNAKNFTEAEFRAARRAEPQLRVDGQPQGVGHAFAEEHAEDRRPALDHQPFDAPLLQLGDDQLRRNWSFG